MAPWNLGRYVLSRSLAALLAACGGSQPPIGGPGALPQSRAIVQHASGGGSWMLPEAKNAKKLLYVSNEFYGNVYVYNFDTGAELGMLSGFVGPSGQCVDGKELIVDPTSTAEDVTAEMLSATAVLEYRSTTETLTALRRAIKEVGISRVAREARLSRSIVKAIVNQGTVPHASTLAKLEAAIKRLAG